MSSNGVSCLLDGVSLICDKGNGLFFKLLRVRFVFGFTDVI